MSDKSLKVLLKLQIETNDHDGYCSGAENEYECKIIKILIDIPDEFASYKESEYIVGYNWDKITQPYMPDINADGSGYCDSCTEATAHNLSIHDARVSVLYAKIVREDYLGPRTKAARA